MKIDRLMGILTLLLQNDRITAPELAERFEVSRRTINRDIEDICRAGIPVIAVQGYGGGFSIAEGYKLDRTFLTREELQTVFAGLRGIDSVSGDSVLNSLRDKLSGGRQCVMTDNVVLIDLASHYQDSLRPKIERIKHAILEKHVLSFQYYYGKGEMKRRIEPYHLVFRWSAWYVFGFCLERQAFRLFKLNRLWDLREDAENFAGRVVPQEELSFEDFLLEKPFHLKAVYENSEKYRLIDEYGIDSFSVREDGKLLFERDFTNYENMREWVFSFGDKVTVLAPAELREDIKRQAENILRRYQEGNTGNMT